jgi:hypothetical protein
MQICGFPSTTIERLLAHDKDIVGVNATTRNYPVSSYCKHLECNFENKRKYLATCKQQGQDGAGEGGCNRLRGDALQG